MISSGTESSRDAVKKATEKLQKQIDSQNEIIIPEGSTTIGTVILSSNKTLTLSENSVLAASTCLEDYPPVVQSTAEESNIALIYGSGCENIVIKGPGCIQGNGGAFFAAEADDVGYKQPQKYRPRPIVLENCHNVRLENFIIRDSPMWTVHLVGCVNVTIIHVEIDNNLSWPNTDAIDIDSCSKVVIDSCRISTADDGVCIKTTKKVRPQVCNDVTITNCNIVSFSSAFKIGTETYYDISDVLILNCRFVNSNRGLGILSRDGGTISNISMKNIDLECFSSPACHWGKADPIHISVRHRDPTILPGRVHHVTIDGIYGVCNGACDFHSEPPNLLTDVSMSNVHLKQQSATKYKEEQGLFDVRPPCNPTSPTGMGLDNAYCMNVETGLPYGVERYPGGLPCIYSDVPITVENVHFERPEPLSEAWNTREIILRASTV